jgi:hypothetical protein
MEIPHQLRLTTCNELRYDQDASTTRDQDFGADAGGTLPAQAYSHSLNLSASVLTPNDC